jgi:hypothetical protein
MPTELVPPYWAGGPPYPPFPTDEGKHGLAILDWFAGHAVAGLMASELINRDFFDQFLFPTGQLPTRKKPPEEKVSTKGETLPAAPAPPGQPLPPTPEELAMIAYAVAGQMAELRKRLPIEPAPVPVTPQPPVEITGPPIPDTSNTPNTFVTVSNEPRHAGDPFPQIPKTSQPS